MKNKETQARTANFKVAHGIYVGVLMAPADVAKAIQNRQGEEYKSLCRWTLCGDVSPGLLDLLQVSHLRPGANERVTAFAAPSGLNYAMFTHQVATLQHRYLVPLFDGHVARCIEEVGRGGGLGYSLAAENDKAIVWPSVLGARDVRPLGALCTAAKDGQEDEALEEYAHVLAEVREPGRIPSLVQGEDVRYVSVSVIPPIDVLERLAQRYGATA